MNPKLLRAVGEWFMELAALIAVFPPLELVLRDTRLSVAMVGPLLCAFVIACVGLYLIARS